ncbi:MAG: TatD family hydrolase [Candidatus Doudnabacteria bacterium]|nr:TatD family hydrolase [Candidatus Doudnabacteria bacterium]
MLIDTHAHVNFRSFKDDAKETLQRALDEGVWVVNIGSQIDTSRQAALLANQFEQGVYAVVGLHPEHTHSQYVDEEETHFRTREEDFDINLYSELARYPKVVGIGECGLDYFRLPDDKNLHNQIKQKQIEVFKKQIRFAKEYKKALVVHSRPEKGSGELYEDMLQVLEEEKVNEMRFVVHSYTHTPEYLQKFLDLGAYVSFNGIITFDKTGNMEKLVKLAPLDKILLETDCPYLAPPPHRGKRNEPLYVKFVAEKLAQLKDLSLDEIARMTSENAKKLFSI